MLIYYPYQWATLDIQLMMFYARFSLISFVLSGNFEVYNLKCGHALMNHDLGTMVLFENPRTNKVIKLVIYLVTVYKLVVLICSHLFHVYPSTLKQNFWNS